MDIQFYETFLEVAQTLSFRAASDNLGVVQSTVSNRIQALEDHFGQTLFNRTNKKVSLTQSGKVVLPYAERIVLLHKEALAISVKATKVKEVLKLAVDPGLYTGKCLGLVNAYTKAHPETSLELVLEPSKKVLAGLSDGLYDLGFVYNKANMSQLEFIPFLKDHFTFIVDGKTEKENDSINKSDLLDLKLIKTDYGSKFDTWLNQFVPKDFAYSMKLMGGSNPVDYIANSDKCGFVIESDLEKSKHKKDVSSVRVKGLDMPYFQSYFVYKTSDDRPKAVTDFIHILNLQK